MRKFKDVDDAVNFLYNMIFIEGDGISGEWHFIIQALMGRELTAREIEHAHYTWLEHFRLPR